MFIKKHWLLIAIVFFALILRIAWLGTIPAGFTPDEASQAYTAYSLLKTGRDEWGIVWPITSFRSFADYKAPLQTYLMIPSIAVFGLNEFAARLPSAVFGVLSVVVIYLLTNLLFNIPDSKLKIGHLAAFLLAISPWHLQFSRTALEVNLSSFLFPLGLLFFTKGLKNHKFFYLTAVAWGLNLYSYHAAKLFMPLFIFSLIIFYLQGNALKATKKLLIPAIIFLFFAIPAYYSMLAGPASTRSNDLLLTNLNTDQINEIADAQYLSPLKKIAPQLPRVFSNKASFTLDKFTENLISYYTPSFWFTEGGREITYSVIPGRGLLYLWQLPFAILGLVYLFKLKPKQANLLITWLALAALPAALTHQGYRPNRAGSFLVFWEIIIAFGIIYFFKFLSKYKKIAKGALSLIILFSFAFYLNDYIFLSPIKYPKSLSYGYRVLISKITPIENNYQQIIFDRGNQSQAFVAFYKQIDPLIFQQYSANWWARFEQTDFTYLDMLDNYRLQNYNFKTINLKSDLVPGNLLVLSASKVPQNYYKYIIDSVTYANNQPAFYLLSINDEEIP